MALTVDAALEIARAAHAEQVDKAGNPYIDHPVAVASRLDESDVDGRIVALLHDVIEDTDVSLADLEAAGASAEILTAVAALTHAEHEPRATYLERVWSVPLARRVKEADLAENSDETRLVRLDPETADRLRAKYARDRAQLVELDAQSGSR